MYISVDSFTSFDTAVSYNMNKAEKGDAYLLGSTLPASGLDKPIQYFNQHLQSCLPHGRIKNVGKHIKASIHSDDQLSDIKFRVCAERILRKFGLADRPSMIFRHTDEPHQHIHIVVSRIKEDGRCVRDSYDGFKSKVVAKELEERFGLIKHEDRRIEKGLRLPTYLEKQYVKSHGRLSGIEYIRNAVRKALDSAKTPSDYVNYLALHNIGIGVKQFEDKNTFSSKGTTYAILNDQPDFSFSYADPLSEGARLVSVEDLKVGYRNEKKTVEERINELKQSGESLYVRDPFNRLLPFDGPLPAQFEKVHVRASRLGPLAKWDGIEEVLGKASEIDLQAVSLTSDQSYKDFFEEYTPLNELSATQ